MTGLKEEKTEKTSKPGSTSQNRVVIKKIYACDFRQVRTRRSLGTMVLRQTKAADPRQKATASRQISGKLHLPAGNFRQPSGG